MMTAQMSANTIPPSSRTLSLFFVELTEWVEVPLEEAVIIGRGAAYEQPTQVNISSPLAYQLGVSRCHVRLEWAGGRLVLYDLHSTNGTSINGRRLIPGRAYDLLPGDELTMGRLHVEVRFT